MGFRVHIPSHFLLSGGSFPDEPWRSYSAVTSMAQGSQAEAFLELQVFNSTSHFGHTRVLSITHHSPLLSFQSGCLMQTSFLHCLLHLCCIYGCKNMDATEQETSPYPGVHHTQPCPKKPTEKSRTNMFVKGIPGLERALNAHTFGSNPISINELSVALEVMKLEHVKGPECDMFSEHH